MMSCFTRNTCDNATTRSKKIVTIAAAEQGHLWSSYSTRDGCKTSTSVSNAATPETGAAATSSFGYAGIIMLGAAWLAFVVMKKL